MYGTVIEILQTEPCRRMTASAPKPRRLQTGSGLSKLSQADTDVGAQTEDEKTHSFHLSILEKLSAMMALKNHAAIIGIISQKKDSAALLASTGSD